MRTLLLGLLVAAMLSACGTLPPSPSAVQTIPPSPSATPALTPSPTTVVYALPTVSDASGACAGIGIEGATITGEPSDPRIAWLTSPTGRRDVVFPPGFTARFTPKIEVLNAIGDVVARDGTVVSGGCMVGPGPNALLLILSQ